MNRKSPRRQRTAEEVDEIYASAIDKIRCWIREKRSTLPPGSANRALLEELQDLPPEKVFDELLSRSYPNPERVGCPPYQVLMELGTRTRSLDDPWFEHICALPSLQHGASHAGSFVHAARSVIARCGRLETAPRDRCHRP